MKVLIISNDTQIVKDIASLLQLRSPDVNVFSVDNTRHGIGSAETESPDLVILDSTLPKISTITVIEQIREISDVALVILASEQNSLERVKELDAGSDEYIIKPLDPIEFLAKIKALLRRIPGKVVKSNITVYLGDELSLNFDTKEVFLSGERLRLTSTEYQLLAELVRNEGKVLTHGTLVEKVEGSEYRDGPSFVRKYIQRLRAKIEPDPGNPTMIITERGMGYRFHKVV